MYDFSFAERCVNFNYDLRHDQHFYIEKLGIKTVYEDLEDDVGFLFMADPFFDPQLSNFMFKIIGSPRLVPHDVEMLDKYDPCFDHLCYIADDVHGTRKLVV